MTHRVFLLLWLVGAGCGAENSAYVWKLPPGFPVPLVDARNPMSVAKAELGRHLFYDVRLSFNGTIACASCHQQSRAFTDGKVNSAGATGDQTPRNAMSLANVAYLSQYTWANTVLTSLEEQALVPMFGDVPLELGVGKNTEEIFERFRNDAKYQKLFAAAFGPAPVVVTTSQVADALASFERTLISGTSAFDRYSFQGEDEALSTSAKRGLELFNSHRLECYHCHAGTTFTTSFVAEGSTVRPQDFHNTGLYSLDDNGAYPPPNTGLHALTGKRSDMGKFRVPSLRNVAVTGPYFHDGSAATLGEVIDAYAAGGRNVTTGPLAGDGRKNPYKSTFIRKFELSQSEREDLIAFLESLTDESFLNNPSFGNPW
jgi:cytochrome c peroxidase